MVTSHLPSLKELRLAASAVAAVASSGAGPTTSLAR